MFQPNPIPGRDSMKPIEKRGRSCFRTWSGPKDCSARKRSSGSGRTMRSPPRASHTDAPISARSCERCRRRFRHAHRARACPDRSADGAQVAVRPLAVEWTLTSVSRSHGRVFALSAWAPYQVYDQASIHDDRNCGAELPALLEIFRKRFPDVLKALVAFILGLNSNGHFSIITMFNRPRQPGFRIAVDLPTTALSTCGG
jgi:hypothetical protein